MADHDEDDNSHRKADATWCTDCTNGKNPDGDECQTCSGNQWY